jgi:hypothetical protein
MAPQTIAPDETLSTNDRHLRALWEAVRRLELISHFGKDSAGVGGPHLLGNDAKAIKNPPPGPPPPIQDPPLPLGRRK